jgi:hypothetical protein
MLSIYDVAATENNNFLEMFDNEKCMCHWKENEIIEKNP